MRTKRLEHSGHHHPLRESNVQAKDGTVCSACELDLSGPAYKCHVTECEFFLHKACFKLPQRIKHKSHPGHFLTLLYSPPGGADEYRCDACGELGTAFNYYCSACDFGIHVKCSSMAETVSREDHQHPLTLCYSVVSDGETLLICDVCDGTVSDGCWAYHCSRCAFSTHLDCATTKVVDPAQEETQKSGPSGPKDPVAELKAVLSDFIKSQRELQKVELAMQQSLHQMLSRWMMINNI